jgi:hypothetical protein
MFCLPVPTLIYLWEIYIFPGSVCLFCCREICGKILGIYKLLTVTLVWKLRLWPRNSFSGNICFEFSVLCLCSGCQKVKCELTVEPALQMKGWYESNINVWFPFMYSQKNNVISKTEL